MFENFFIFLFFLLLSKSKQKNVYHWIFCFTYLDEPKVPLRKTPTYAESLRKQYQASTFYYTEPESYLGKINIILFSKVKLHFKYN